MGLTWDSHLPCSCGRNRERAVLSLLNHAAKLRLSRHACNVCPESWSYLVPDAVAPYSPYNFTEGDFRTRKHPIKILIYKYLYINPILITFPPMAIHHRKTVRIARYHRKRWLATLCQGGAINYSTFAGFYSVVTAQGVAMGVPLLLKRNLFEPSES